MAFIMIHPRKYPAHLALALLLAVACVAHAQENSELLPEDIEKLVLSKRERIERESATVRGNEWVGKYHATEYLTVTSILDWSPTSGFTVWRENCSRPGIARVNYGSVNFNERALVLSPERAGSEPHTYAFSSAVLVPVKWGQQHWLIPSDRLTLFAYAVNSGSIDEIETFFVKNEDYFKEREGRPDLPKEYKKYLNAKPIRARVSAIGADDGKWFPPLILNVGKTAGVVEGMKFWLTGVEAINVELYVTEIGERSSVARVVSAGTSGAGDPEIKPKVGWRFTSKMPTYSP